MITIQELHRYMSLVEMRMAPALKCPIDPEHMFPVATVKDDQPALWCLECNSKLTIGERRSVMIKKLLGNVSDNN